MSEVHIAAQADDMLFERIRDICQEVPRVAILMSGKGSNARNILERWRAYSHFNFVAVVTDNPSSSAALIASQFNLSFILAESRGNLPVEQGLFIEDLSDKLRYLRINFLVYAGFMRIVPKSFLTEFPGINIHPSDLTLIDEKSGLPKYRGFGAIRQALDAGERHIASTVHVVEEKADCGLVIAVSQHIPLAVGITYNINELHEELKRRCEHTLYPQVLALLGRGEIFREHLPLRAKYQDIGVL